jgi:predicted nucleic acid-binding protein
VIVLDCSYALALVMPDEERPATMAEVEATQLVAPPIWSFEVANAFAMAVRRGRLAAEDAAHLARRLDDYGVGVDGDDVSVHQRYLAAQNHPLTAYDAAYLELALQRRYALATLDARMAARARGLGMTVHQ